MSPSSFKVLHEKHPADRTKWDDKEFKVVILWDLVIRGCALHAAACQDAWDEASWGGRADSQSTVTTRLPIPTRDTMAENCLSLLSAAPYFYQQELKKPLLVKIWSRLRGATGSLLGLKKPLLMWVLSRARGADLSSARGYSWPRIGYYIPMTDMRVNIDVFLLDEADCRSLVNYIQRKGQHPVLSTIPTSTSFFQPKLCSGNWC